MKKRMKRHAIVQPLGKPHRFIPLTQGQNAIVDAIDFDWLSRWNWQANWNHHTKSFYARRDSPLNRNGKRRHIWMHRIIIKCRNGEKGDHKNRNTLDNRRGNLRKCTSSQNGHNAKLYTTNESGFKGVHWDKDGNRFRMSIAIKGKHITTSCASAKDAAQMYDAIAKKHYGPFAHLNFPKS